ncbi:hypothetical protein BGX31_007741 [Mortierella sp. GBA43]|nr:hypothetical protein BGX31_007741 [Mortierella sp. GBA43]
MDLPEIRAAVVPFLSRSDLARAARVSIPTYPNSPGKQAVTANSPHIRDLYLRPLVTMLDIDYMRSDDQLCFPALKQLCLTLGFAFLPQCQVEIIRKCPNLKDLSWFINDEDSYPVNDVCDLFKTHCPFVESLDLNGHALKDDDLSKIIDSCSGITQLTAIPCKIGELAFQSLSRHFGHVRKLRLTEGTLTSEMAQRILTNCPNLTELHGVTLEARDILGIDKRNPTQEKEMAINQDWVCSNLENLTIFICGLAGKPREWHQSIFQQLSRMKMLCSLSVGPVPPIRQRSLDGLDLRLEAGLDCLSSLKRLRMCKFGGLSQEMGEEEVRWIMEAWPGLRVLHGRLHDDPDQLEKLRLILNKNTDLFHG